MFAERVKKLNHLFNSVHVYCRLVDWGVDRKRARRVSLRYEKFVHPIIYGFGGLLVRMFG